VSQEQRVVPPLFARVLEDPIAVDLLQRACLAAYYSAALPYTIDPATKQPFWSALEFTPTAMLARHIDTRFTGFANLLDRGTLAERGALMIRDAARAAS